MKALTARPPDPDLSISVTCHKSGQKGVQRQGGAAPRTPRRMGCRPRCFNPSLPTRHAAGSSLHQHGEPSTPRRLVGNQMYARICARDAPERATRQRRRDLDKHMRHPQADVIAAIGDRTRRQRCTSYGSSPRGRGFNPAPATSFRRSRSFPGGRGPFACQAACPLWQDGDKVRQYQRTSAMKVHCGIFCRPGKPGRVCLLTFSDGRLGYAPAAQGLVPDHAGSSVRQLA
jgi:hypothetical protein